MTAGTRYAAGTIARQDVADRARALGFDICRIVEPGAAPQAGPALDDWLAAGAHGSMDWMADTAERRRDPHSLWPDVRSIVMLGMNYGPDCDPLAVLERADRAAISVYARHRDYHDVVKGRLKMLAQWMLAQSGAKTAGSGEVKVFVDTAPVMEKPLAAAAGVGWQGKHTNLVSREFGSWLFLGSIFTTLDLAPDQPEPDHCGSCRSCLDICPTNAFPGPYRIDARRCISYLTIEYKGHIDKEFRKAMGNRIYGCDDCLAVCPWNKFAQQASEAKLKARADLAAPQLSVLLQLDEAGFRNLFSGSPVKRIGHARFLRNVLIAAGNSRIAALLPLIVTRLRHPSELVRAMAVWAAGELAAADTFETLAQTYMPQETDRDAIREWRQRLQDNSGQTA